MDIDSSILDSILLFFGLYTVISVFNTFRLKAAATAKLSSVK